MLSIVVSPLCILTDFFLITALSGGYYSYSHVSKLRLGNFPKKVLEPQEKLKVS